MGGAPRIPAWDWLLDQLLDTEGRGGGGGLRSLVGPGGQGHGRDGRPSCCVALPTAPSCVSACKAGGGPHLWGYVRQRGRQVTAAWHLWDGGPRRCPQGPTREG